VSPPILVRKYGGSSLADLPRLREVARDLRDCRARGTRLVVVVSAMGRTTDDLLALARGANPDPPRRELDMLLSVGERIAMSLLCMALAAENCPAVSFTGSQCGIITDTSHTDARILEVRADRVREALEAGNIVVVAGFQGVSRDREITTLGRGGSDATAVALAAALGAERCEILKDVDGVMTADPDVVPEARRHDHLSYDEMQAIADAGCGVVHPHAVAYAREHGVRIVVGSSFRAGPGTVVANLPAHGQERQHGLERPDQLAPPDQLLQPEEVLRPLVLQVDEHCGRLRAAWSTATAARVVLTRLARAETQTLAAQWLDVSPHGFWEGWGEAVMLDRVQAALMVANDRPLAAVALDRTDGFTCLSLAGARPRSWPGVLISLRTWLEARGLDDCVVRNDGATVRVLAPAATLPGLAQDLHDWLLPA
jgi:uridylate kinase